MASESSGEIEQKKFAEKEKKRKIKDAVPIPPSECEFVRHLYFKWAESDDVKVIHQNCLTAIAVGEELRGSTLVAWTDYQLCDCGCGYRGNRLDKPMIIGYIVLGQDPITAHGEDIRQRFLSQCAVKGTGEEGAVPRYNKIIESGYRTHFHPNGALIMLLLIRYARMVVCTPASPYLVGYARSGSPNYEHDVYDALHFELVADSLKIDRGDYAMYVWKRP